MFHQLYILSLLACSKKKRRERFESLFDLVENKSSTVVKMSYLGWKAGGKRECDRVSCEYRRRRCWGSDRLYFMISFCRPNIHVCDSGRS
jgi:hypothetical protein